MIRKLGALALILALLMPFSAFSESNDAVFQELGNYLLYADRLLEDELFAIKYVEQFDKSRTQDDLLTARCAITSALNEIRHMALPEMSLSEDEYFSYMIAGAEVEALALLYENLSAIRDEKILTLTGMLDTMTLDVYFEPALDNLIEKTKRYRLDIEYDALDLVYMTNYLLLQLKDGGQTSDFWNTISKETAVLSGYMDVFFEDISLIPEKTSENLDRMKENIDEIDVLTGFEDYFLNITFEAIEKNDLSVFKDNRTEIAGEGTVFPFPEWEKMPEAEYQYIFSEPETGNLFLHSMGQEILMPPDRIKITVPGITIDDMQMYLDSLTLLEYNPVYEFSSEGDVLTLYLMAEKDESMLMVIWNKTETLLYLQPPVISLVPYMYWK